MLKIFATIEENSSIKEIITETMIKPVINHYEGEQRKKVIELHSQALLKVMSQPFLVYKENNKISAFLSWTKGTVLGTLNAVITTHWVDSALESTERAKIHQAMFEYLNSLSATTYVASIFYKNSKSINLFKKNNYKLHSVKLVRL